MKHYPTKYRYILLLASWAGHLLAGTVATATDTPPSPSRPASRAEAESDLERGFLHPPDAAKPQSWWHWREGRINPEAITAELEAMQRIGLGGVTMFAVARYGETGPNLPCLSPEWYERVRFALRECDRLGLRFNFMNCPGWSTSGGPWITPDKNMMHVVSTRHAVAAGTTLQLDAPPSWPEKGTTYYRDLAVVAFPTPPICRDAAALPAPAITSNFVEHDPGRLNVSEAKTPKPPEALTSGIEAGKVGWVQFEFPSAVTCRSVTIAGPPTPNLPPEHGAWVLASDDGRDFRSVIRLCSYYTSFHRSEAPVTHAIPPTTARFFRLAWDGPVKLMLRRVAWSTEPAITALESKAGELGRTYLAEPILGDEPGTVVVPQQVIDLTSQLDGKGHLVWTAPPGAQWTVVRIGYRNTGKRIAPVASHVAGLECDKFNPEAVALHFKNYAGEMLRNAAIANSRSLTGLQLDSWEAASQNWSPRFRDEFLKRRGYDPLKFLPVFEGFVVGNRDQADRFLRDLRQTMSDLISEVYYGGMVRLARAHGLQVYAESCGSDGAGTMVADPAQHFLYVDVPMTEFGDQLKIAASAAHLTGKPVVALEAFTQGRADWQSCPASLKALGDTALCDGINRFVFHTCAHNPDLDKIYPGPAFGPYGLVFQRGQTWWEMGRAWITYLSRCQFLLQRGRAVADVLYFYGEEPAGPIRPSLDESVYGLPKGGDYELLPPEILIRDLAVKDGKLTLPSGVSYRLLVLRDSERMTPEAAAKIRQLVRDGAAVLGPRPTHSPSLADYPQCDAVVRSIGEEVWGNCDGKKVTSRVFGKGRVFSGLTLKKALAAMSLAPDFAMSGTDAGADIRFIHRRDGEAEIYFVANNTQKQVTIDAGFRVAGKRPELWDPVTGTKRGAAAFRQQDGRTILPLELAPSGSLFVVFRETIPAATRGTAKRNLPLLTEALKLPELWRVAFTPGWGAPEAVTFNALEDWARRPEPGIQYYSGTATYTTNFGWRAPVSRAGRLYIDLGNVQVIAGVKLNGVDCGVAWTEPYRVEITSALRTGENTLEVRVANTWANALKGEGKVANRTRTTWTTFNPYSPDLPATWKAAAKDCTPVPSGLLGPVRVMREEQTK